MGASSWSRRKIFGISSPGHRKGSRVPRPVSQVRKDCAHVCMNTHVHTYLWVGLVSIPLPVHFGPGKSLRSPQSEFTSGQEHPPLHAVAAPTPATSRHYPVPYSCLKIALDEASLPQPHHESTDTLTSITSPTDPRDSQTPDSVYSAPLPLSLCIRAL